ncbi:MAG: PepSY domain-containing protein, partial [Moraxellaceae bacterium]
GTAGAIVVELAACWAIVLVLTGVYLWWPRTAKGFAGVLYPRIFKNGRIFWRDLHSVIGIWISFFVLFLLLSGLPWAFVWGNVFKEFRQLTGSVQVSQDWNIAGEHQHHMKSSENNSAGEDHSMHHQLAIDTIIRNAESLGFAYPVLLTAPSTESHYWTVKSNAQNRMLRADAIIDAQTGEIINKKDFSTRHPIDQVIGIGVAAHEGQLFGWFNQLLGLLTALGLVAMSVAGVILWRKRAPSGVLGAPPVTPDARLGKGFITIILLSAILLPLLGISLIVIAALEVLIFSRSERTRLWLGLQ